MFFLFFFMQKALCLLLSNTSPVLRTEEHPFLHRSRYLPQLLGLAVRTLLIRDFCRGSGQVTGKAAHNVVIA